MHRHRGVWLAKQGGGSWVRVGVVRGIVAATRVLLGARWRPSANISIRIRTPHGGCPHGSARCWRYRPRRYRLARMAAHITHIHAARARACACVPTFICTTRSRTASSTTSMLLSFSSRPRRSASTRATSASTCPMHTTSHRSGAPQRACQRMQVRATCQVSGGRWRHTGGCPQDSRFRGRGKRRPSSDRLHGMLLQPVPPHARFLLSKNKILMAP